MLENWAYFLQLYCAMNSRLTLSGLDGLSMMDIFIKNLRNNINQSDHGPQKCRTSVLYFDKKWRQMRIQVYISTCYLPIRETGYIKGNLCPINT
jgi:hypothetical protein